MRSSCMLYVDVGYLLSSAATRITGTSLRNGINVDYSSLIRGMAQQCEAHGGLPLIRVNWYDSGTKPGGQPDHVQASIGLLPKVKLRLGRLSAWSGEQKGVDLKLGIDMITHSSVGRVDAIYLLSGDDDLTEAVEIVQGQGVIVNIVSVALENGQLHGVSTHLMREADEVIMLDDSLLLQSITSPSSFTGARDSEARDSGEPSPARPTPLVMPKSSSGHQKSYVAVGPPVLEPVVRESDESEEEYVDRCIRVVPERVIKTWLRTANGDARRSMLAGYPSVPSDVDRALLLDASQLMGVDSLGDDVRIRLRSTFWDEINRLDITEVDKRE